MFWKSHGIEKKDLLTPGSVLIGCILISLSILCIGGKLGSGMFAINNNAPTAAGDGSAQVAVVERKDAPKEGSGKVKVVEFADFQCPYCQAFYNASFKTLKAEYIDTGKVQFEYRHFPLSMHVNAQIAAEAGECANMQGKFFPMYDTLFTKGQADGTGLTAANLKSYAAQLGLDTQKFNRCLDNGDAKSIVKADYEAGSKAGVTGTPTFFINGKMIVGNQPIDVFRQEIEAALK